MADHELKWKIPKKREFLGGDLVAQSLAQLGVEVSFGLHGGHLDAFLVGCELAGIRLIDTRHEAPAVQAAEAYAKLSGKVGCCFVTANSGFCNSLPGLATAFADRSPIFMVTSSPPLRDAETNCLQGFHDQVVLAKPITKFTHRVTNVEEIPRIVSYAYKTAISGIPGPVVVDFPIDVLFHPPRMNALAFGSVTKQTALSPGPDPAALDEMISLWKAASRPAIITGTGAARTTNRDSSKTSPLLQLAEATNTPVFYSQKYSPAIPFDHTLRGGSASLLAHLPFLKKQRPDFILLLGARTGFLLAGRSGALIPNTGCKLVQVDLDGGEIGKSHAVDLGIVSDANKFITAILEKLQSQGGNTIQKHDSWLQDIQEIKNQPSMYTNDKPTRPDGRLHPYFAMKSIMTSLPTDSIIIIDGGECGVWASSLQELARPSTGIVSTGYLGFLGNGWGYSLGAALACPGKLIVNIHGDGSAGFHIQELDTYARHGLNVLTIVFNNNFWGMSVAGQDLIYNTDESARPVVKLSESCRYDIVAQGFNVRAALAKDSIEDVEKHVRELTGEKGPGLINVLVSRDPVTEVTKGMVGKTEDKDWIVVPYYDNVPRPFYREDLEREKEKERNGEEVANGH